MPTEKKLDCECCTERSDCGSMGVAGKYSLRGGHVRKELGKHPSECKNDTVPFIWNILECTQDPAL